MYADGSELLVLTALVTSDSLPKNRFFDRLKGVVHPDDPFQSVKKATNRQNTKYLISMRHCEPID